MAKTYSIKLFQLISATCGRFARAQNQLIIEMKINLFSDKVPGTQTIMEGVQKARYNFQLEIILSIRR